MTHVLALNAGSSSLKYTLFEGNAEQQQQLASGNLKSSEASPQQTLELVLERLAAQNLPEPSIVGHRIVHGGPMFTEPVRVDQEVLRQLDRVVSLAPLHLPPALALLRAALTRLSSACHVACFDTAFHHTLPVNAARLPLPLELYERGIRRYGFHGLSYEYVVSALGSPPPSRLVVAHLGSGSSMAAIRDGRCIDTSMGLTPAGGLPMATRSGDLDPGVLIHLLREKGFSVDQLERLIDRESGLKGLGGDADVAELIRRAGSGDTAARSAIEQFCYAIKKQLGAYLAALGGLDTLVFTGGIGENSALVRELSCHGLAELGVELDPSLNAANATVISSPASRCQVRVIPTKEDLIIARAAVALAGAAL
jgi:acetate kinase